MQNVIVIEVQPKLVELCENPFPQAFSMGVVDAVINPAHGITHQQPEVLARVGVREYLLGRVGIGKADLVGPRGREARDTVFLGVKNIKAAQPIHGEITREDEVIALDARTQGLAIVAERDAEELSRREAY